MLNFFQNIFFIKFIHRTFVFCLTVLFNIIYVSQTYCGPAEIYLQKVGRVEDFIFVGDTIQFNVRIDAKGEKITGAAFFLTVDAEVFQPIINEYYEPFIPGSYISETAVASINGTHGDSLHLDASANRIDGFQLDYYQSVGPAFGGDREYVTGKGILATFKLLAIGVPDNEQQSTTITFDHSNLTNRKTCYYTVENPGLEITFSETTNFTGIVKAFYIHPPLPDTLITPGSSLEIPLRNRIVTSLNVSAISWYHNIIQPLDNTNIEIIDKILYVSSDTSTHGILKINITAMASNNTLTTSQMMSIGIDYPPEFVDPVPEIQFNEDEQLKIGKSDLFYDDDDSLANVNVFLKSANIHVTNINDSIIFHANENWFGQEDVPFYLKDELQTIFKDSTAKNIQVTVISVNDPPELDLSSLNPITVNHLTPKYITLMYGVHVFDVDDETFTWSVESDDDTKLTASFEGTNLRLEAIDINYVGNIKITVTATDDENGSDSEAITVNIKGREFAPPIISNLPIIYKAPNTTYKLSLNNYVEDEDTPKDQLQWSFVVRGKYNYQVDNQVFAAYNHSSQELEISSTPNYSAIDILKATVVDPTDSSDTESTKLLVFGSYAPLMAPLPLIIMPIDTILDVLNLDTVIYDLTDDPKDIQWTVNGIDYLDDVIIDSSHHVKIRTNEFFVGVDTINFTATNSKDLSTSGNIVVRCVGPNSGPLFYKPLPDANFISEVVTAQPYVDLDDFIWDFLTPDSLIGWTAAYDTNYMKITITDTHFVFIHTKNKLGQQTVYFTATNEKSYSTTDTVIFNIKGNTPPVWKKLDNVLLSKHSSLKLYDLREKCSDDVTPTSQLVFGYETETPPKINVIVEPIVELSVRDTTFSGSTWLRFSATDGSGKKSWSNTITVSLGRSKPPIWWAQIPTIEFANNEVFSALYLNNYCQDPEGQKLSYIAKNVHSLLNIRIIDSTSQVLLSTKNGFCGEADVVFKAFDLDSNVTSTVANLKIYDRIPPEGTLSYYYNTITSQRINFIVTADASVNRISHKFIANTIYENLDFKLLDSDNYKKIWSAMYKFREAGIYRLKVTLYDNSGFITVDSLNWSVNLRKPMAGFLQSNDSKLKIEYPANANVRDHYIILIESTNNMNDIKSSKIYSIVEECSENEALLVSYRKDQLDDNFYSFYKIKDDCTSLVETFIDDHGNFKAVLENNDRFIFAKSDIQASLAKLPMNEVLCYPNPFNSTIKMKYFISQKSDVKIDIFNILGQSIYSKHFDYIDAGIQTFSWNGTNNDNQFVPSGIYFVRLHYNSKFLLKKITMVK